MLGMEMMLKSLGLDPAAILAQAQGIGAAFADIRERLERIEGNQKLIMSALGIPLEFPPEILQIASDASAQYVAKLGEAETHVG